MRPTNVLRATVLRERLPVQPAHASEALNSMTWNVLGMRYARRQSKVGLIGDRLTEGSEAKSVN
jgi:hypothetical protein